MISFDENTVFNDFNSFDEEFKKAQKKQKEKKQKSSVIAQKVEQKKEELNLTTDEELRNAIPGADSKKHGAIKDVRLDGVAITEDGELVKTKYFDNFDIKKVIYGDIVFTPQEAFALAAYYKNLTKGVNAVIPLKCTGPQCKFAEDCIYQQMNKAPIGKGCLLEYDMLNYHTNNFAKQFQVAQDNYAEQMLVGELAEILVYEMRISRVLAEPDNATMMGVRIKFSPDGDMMQEETAHWAVEIKEKFKNRKMKIIDALNKNKKNDNDDLPQNYQSFIAKVSSTLAEYQTKKIQEMNTTEFTEIKE
jgi:hypothetical protein